ncbi:MAG TPA: nucleotidyltransferase domain-containing protein [Candidatus Gastranaerophilales bacterium]|nr:nucleotidyltransferase domain-containing protein [Candidatus Gastranaerophilales bacterium]
MAKKPIMKKLKDYIKAIKNSNIKVEVAFLFGSYAENRAGEDSDIDVAVVSPDFGKDFFDECVKLKEISEKFDFDISPRAYSLEEYQNVKEGDFLYQEIIKKGKIIKV